MYKGQLSPLVQTSNFMRQCPPGWGILFTVVFASLRALVGFHFGGDDKRPVTGAYQTRRPLVRRVCLVSGKRSRDADGPEGVRETCHL